MLKFNSEKIDNLKSKINDPQRYQILIVDDELANLNIMSSILLDQYEVLRAFDGVEALKRVAELDNPERLSLVISDQRMPNMTGIELFQRLSAIIPRTIRIIVTGYVDASVIVDSVNKAKIYKYILKPFDRADFLLTVDRAVEAYRMQQKLDKYFRKTIEEKEKEVCHQKEVKNLKQEAVNALQESNNLKDDFLRIISHELRTPLNVICGNLSLTLDCKLSKEVRQYISIVHESSEDLLSIIDKILYFTELLSNKVLLEKKPVHIRDLMDHIVVRCMSLAAMKSITLSLDVADDVGEQLMMDQEKVTYIIDEIIKNALTFTHHGTVWVSVRRLVCSGVERLCCQVIDTGPGITEEKQKHIFTAFNQVDSSYRREVGGLGIGLSICQQLAALFDANISVDSELGNGCSFTLLLPYVLADQEQRQEKGLAQAEIGQCQNTQSKKILIVEDNKVNQLLLTKIVDLLGYRVVSADNGQEAVDYLKTEVVDLVFMDCQMPIMDGFDATRLIRKMTNSNGKCPIVAVTANAMHQDKEKCLACGMDEFVKKPIKKCMIEKILKSYLMG